MARYAPAVGEEPKWGSVVLGRGARRTHGGGLGVPAAHAAAATSDRIVEPVARAPFSGLLRVWLEPETSRGRWAIAAGPNVQAAAIWAEALLEDRARAHDELVVRSGDPHTDALIADLAPALVALLRHLTDRQRTVGRLLLVDGLRRSEIAERLGISRPTVSVMVDRARLVEIGRVASGLDALFQTGLERAAEDRGVIRPDGSRAQDDTTR